MARLRHYFDSSVTPEADGDTYKRHFYDIEATPWEVGAVITDEGGKEVLFTELAEPDRLKVTALMVEARSEACDLFELYHEEKRWI